MKTPVLIIGSGLAGMSVAYECARKGIDCVMVSSAEHPLQGSNSVYAQGGIVVRSPGDSAELLEKDIFQSGAHIHDPRAVQQLAEQGPSLVQELLLEQLKVPFDRESGELHYTQEAAHSMARILHVKDHTGRAIMEAFWKALEGHPKVKVLSQHSLVDLLTSAHHTEGYQSKYHKNRCLGAYLLDHQSAEVIPFVADHTVLATGGVGQLYAYHTNSEWSYGAGLSVANRAGARILNAHFVQFHPTALWTARKGRRFLISEALRGEGARLQALDGRFLMEGIPEGDLAPRAVVSQVIAQEMEQSQQEYVLLNIADFYTGSTPLEERFPSIFQHCLEEGIDIRRQPIPVVPAEHFFCGGIQVDHSGRTELEGLFAVGEVSCTGVHGANRLASTSLLECLTWGVKAAEALSDQNFSGEDQQFLQRAQQSVLPWESTGQELLAPEEILKEKEALRLLMWQRVGILRTSQGLLSARSEIRDQWKRVQELYLRYRLTPELLQLRHMVEAAYVIVCTACQYRNLQKDSIGAHFLR